MVLYFCTLRYVRKITLTEVLSVGQQRRF